MYIGGKKMLNVFMKKSAEELHVQLSDGRMMLLEDLVRDYERLLGEEHSKDEPSKEMITSKLKVGEWFRIDREIIRKNRGEIRRKCKEAGIEGEKLLKRFNKSNEIADENPDRYPRLIDTYIFEHYWDRESIEEMREMCKDVGEGMCCEVICDLELQMRIYNGESVKDLVEKPDKLPYKRIIKLLNGGNGAFGGGEVEHSKSPSASLIEFYYPIGCKTPTGTPYAFRRVSS